MCHVARNYTVIREPNERRPWIMGMVVFTIVVVSATYAVAGSAVTYDDGYYYFRIAQQIAAGNGATFDGIHLTNGFHPLWLLALIPVGFVLDDPSQLEAAAIVLQGALYGASLALSYGLFARWVDSLTAWLAMLLLLVSTCRFAWMGLEFSLTLLVLLLLARALVQTGTQERLTPRQAALLGSLSALLVAARLEFGLLAVLIALRLALRRKVAPLVLYLLPVCLVGLVWLGFSANQEGHLLPVNAWLKRDWSAQYLAADPLYERLGWFAAKASQVVSPLMRIPRTTDLPLASANGLLAIGVFVAPWLLCSRRSRVERDPWLCVLCVFGVAQYLVYATLLHGGFAVVGWYYQVQPLMAALAIAILAQPALRALRTLKHGHLGTAVVLTIAGLIVAASLLFMWDLRRGPMELAAAWVRTNTPVNARIGAWNAGYLGFYSERRVINLDGLVNDWTFAKTGQSDLCTYWRANDLDYIVDYYDPSSTPNTHIRVWAPVPVFEKYRRCVSNLRRVATIRDPTFADPTLEIHIYERVSQ